MILAILFLTFSVVMASPEDNVILEKSDLCEKTLENLNREEFAFAAAHLTHSLFLEPLRLAFWFSGLSRRNLTWNCG
jgi:hypothetical protein